MYIYLDTVRYHTAKKHMLKNRMIPTRNYSERRRPFSSKRAAAQGMFEGIAWTLRILHQIEEGKSLRDDFHTQAQITRKLWDLECAGYVSRHHNVRALTSCGDALISEEKIWNLAIPTPKKWDGRWRMVLFDIPAKKNKQRNSFRSRLKEMGLVLYQNSVWIYPHPLEKEVQTIAHFYMISNCVLLAVAEKLYGEEKLKKHFKIA
jgi:hypothetical protein